MIRYKEDTQTRYSRSRSGPKDLDGVLQGLIKIIREGRLWSQSMESEGGHQGQLRTMRIYTSYCHYQ